MTFYVTDQNTVVLVFAILGAVFAFLADVIKVKRRFLKSGRIMSAIEDLFYCMICTALFQITVFVTNYGYIRWYEFAAQGLGYAFYVLIPGDIIRRVLVAFAGIVSWLVHILILPFNKVYRYVLRSIKRSCTYIARLMADKRSKLYSERMSGKIIAMSEKGFIKQGKGR